MTRDPTPARCTGTSSTRRTTLGLRRERHPHPHRHEGERGGSQDRDASRAQRLPLHLRSLERPVPQGHALCRKVTWTRGIDPKTGKPLDYDPSKDLQTYAADATGCLTVGTSSMCPGVPAATISGRRPTAGGPRCSTSRARSLLRYHAPAGSRNKAASARAAPTSRSGSPAVSVVDPPPARQEEGPSLPQLGGVLTTAGGIVVTGYPTAPSSRRRPDARGTVEDQRRHRLQRAADDLRGRRQAIPRDPRA